VKHGARLTIAKPASAAPIPIVLTVTKREKRSGG